jgi:hypothetical protein
MVKQASNMRKHLRRFLTVDPGRFAGGSAVSDPLGLLATERERLERDRRPHEEPGLSCKKPGSVQDQLAIGAAVMWPPSGLAEPGPGAYCG